MISRLTACAVAALGFAASAAEESVGGTILPYGIMTCGGEPAALAERLVAINAESGITNFVLHGPGKHVRITGMLGREAYAANGRTLKAVADILRPKGMKVGYWLAPTMNCGIRHPYRKYVTEPGAERTFTPCVGDRTFRADFAANCAAVAAEAHPHVFLMEDDFRYFGSGCFCADHLRRLGEKTGRTWTREEVSAALKRVDAGGAKLRRTWHGLFVDDLTAIATAAREAVHAVSPETRLGLCMPGWFPENDTATFARALAGPKHRPLVRCAGAFYGHSKSVELPGRMFVAQWSRENFPADFECILEADPCPHSRFYGSAARLGAMTSCAAAYGYDGALFIGLGGGFFSGPGAADDPLRTTPDFLRLHRREVTRWESIAAEARKGASVGLQVVYSPRERLDAQADWKAPIPYPEFAPWARTLACMGLPYATHEASVRLFATQWAFDDYDGAAITNLLAGRVVLDGAAAETLTARGFAPLLGVSAVPRDKIDFTGEMSVGPDGTARSFTCSYHTNYGLDGAPVSRLTAAGAEELAFFHAGDATKKVQPSVTYFENALGGRVAVLAPNLDFCESPNVFSFAKRDFLVGLFRRLGGDRAVPARVIDRANAQLIANADPEDKRLMLHVLNLSEDPIDSLELEVLPPYAGGTVEILDGDTWRPQTGRWDGVRLTLSVSAQVYKTVVLRIAGGAGTECLVPRPREIAYTGGAFRETDAAKRVYATDASLPKEGYALTVAADGIRIASADADGRYWAERTLDQLRRDDGSYPCCMIRDWPEFHYRGIFLDEGRHYYGVADVKRLIDEMVRVKLNVFHWHLVEHGSWDQDCDGWRVQVPGYPRLTEKVKKSYSRAELEEVVAYAAKRHVRVVPEIEMPGHNDVTHYYPEFGHGGKGGGICVANEKAVRFFTDTIDYATSVFPDAFFHFGGDEVAYANWKACPDCQAKMKALGLKTEAELQAWFMNEMALHLKAKGRTALGWNDMLTQLTNKMRKNEKGYYTGYSIQKNLSKDVVLTAWYGDWECAGGSGAICANLGYKTLHYPFNHCYFDYPQGIPGDTNPYCDYGGVYFTLRDAYMWDPYADVKPECRKNILGICGCNWSEKFSTDLKALEWRCWPRGFATAEIAWTCPKLDLTARDSRQFAEFKARAQELARRFRRDGIAVAHQEGPGPSDHLEK